MKKLISFAIVMLPTCFLQEVLAQEKPYTLQIHTVGNHLPQPLYNKFRFKPLSGLAIQAERSVWGNLGLGLKYSFWLPWKWQHHPYEHPLATRIKMRDFHINEEGYVNDGRYNYHFLDLFACYKYSVHPRHQFSIRQSTSYAAGKIDYVKYDPNPWGGDIIGGVGKTEKENYWGGSTQLSYDYLRWKKRINIGGDIGARYYFGLPYVNFTYEAHIGFNF